MRYLITGGSGYLGSRLTEHLVQRDDVERVVNLDVRPPDVPWPKTEFVQGDVRDRAAVRELLERERIDALIHLAFILNPIHDEPRMYDVDVNGTQAVLEAASDANVQQVLVTSSTTAYGAFPDNPRPIAEDHPVRGHPHFPYARDKADADRLCQLWAAQHPDRVMTIVRPCIVFGPNVDNFISRSFRTVAFMPIMDGIEEEFQLVHEDDVSTAIIGLLENRESGAFNVTGDGTMRWSEAARLVDLKLRRMSFRTVYRLYDWAWKLHAPRVEAPAGNLYFIHHPWVASNEKLKAAIGWEPTRTTRETFEEAMRAKGLLQPAAAASAATPAAA